MYASLSFLWHEHVMWVSVLCNSQVQKRALFNQGTGWWHGTHTRTQACAHAHTEECALAVLQKLLSLKGWSNWTLCIFPFVFFCLVFYYRHSVLLASFFPWLSHSNFQKLFGFTARLLGFIQRHLLLFLPVLWPTCSSTDLIGWSCFGGRHLCRISLCLICGDAFPYLESTFQWSCHKRCPKERCVHTVLWLKALPDSCVTWPSQVQKVESELNRAFETINLDLIVM